MPNVNDTRGSDELEDRLMDAHFKRIIAELKEMIELRHENGYEEASRHMDSLLVELAAYLEQVATELRIRYVFRSTIAFDSGLLDRDNEHYWAAQGRPTIAPGLDVRRTSYRHAS